MWKNIFAFELQYQARQPLFALSALIFFALGVALASSDIGTAIGDSPGTTLRNAPIVVARLMPILSLLGLFAITAFVASAALRDFERRCDMFFFTKPLHKIDYLGGRFAGSMAISLGVLLAAVLGLAVANFVPWQPADRLGAFSLGSYAFGLLVILVPNLLTMGALFFALAIWSRRMTLTYLCVVFFIGMQDTIEVVAQNLESRMLGSLLEPSGIVALETAARYWTIAEQNTRLPPLGGVLLANRLLWLGLAFAVLALSVWRFEVAGHDRKSAKERKTKAKNSVKTVALPASSIVLPTARLRFSAADSWRQLLRQTRLELSEVLASAPFLTLLSFGLMFVVAYSFVAGAHDGMPSYPLTHLMLQAIGLGVRLTLVLILVLYAGELVFHHRASKMSDVYDALPVKNWVLLGSKLAALVSIAGVFLLAAAASTVAVQLSKGFVRLEPGLYARGLLVQGLPLLPLIVLAICLQVLANRKLMGLLLVVVALILKFALPRLGFENNLYLYGGLPPLQYTDLNGYGHQAEPFSWFLTYWFFGALVLWAVALLFWPRGTDLSKHARLAAARERLTKPVIATAVVGLLGLAGVGAWIFYNTSVRNEYLDRDRILQRLTDYERNYKQYENVTLPRITSVYTEVDIFPEDRRLEIRGSYHLENKGAEPIQILPISRSPRWVEGVLRVYGGVSFDRFDLPPHTVLVQDDTLGFYVFELEQPLLPGAAIDLGFTVSVDHRGFVNRRHNDLVIANGTFFSNRNFLPSLGYAGSNQLQDPPERRRRGLPPIERTAKIDNVAARERNYLEADWVRFEAIVSTRSDQVAIAPGDLVRSWTEGGRSYFHYKTRAPIVDMFPILSGSYEVARERWQDVDIEVYFHPGHGFNIDRMIETTRKTLTYMTESLGPYPHGQLRIVEIPNYHGKLAFSLAGTIPFSETWCFASQIEGAELDWLTGILAHEVAHQWWNHQVVPANVQGATLIAESLSQYSAMRVLEEMYGPASVRRFLKFHLDRYLERRGNERVGELPLSLVENQDYIHYSKASLALYSLEDLIGGAVLDRALRSFFEANHFAGPPYPTSRELLAQLRTVVPAQHEHLVEDLFETITLFDNRVVEADYTEQPDGRFLVHMKVSAKKLRADGQGDTTDVAIDDWVDIGIFGERESDGKTEETVLLLEKRQIQASPAELTFFVAERPVRAGIDPYNKLVDRDSGDNVRDLAELPHG